MLNGDPTSPGGLGCAGADRGREHRVVAWGTGKPTREFLYVEDCARGIVLATQAYDQGKPVNLGAGFEISIWDLAEKIRRLVGLEGELVWDASKSDGQPRRCLDTFRAARLFGFGATVAPDEGLRRTVD